MDRPFRKRRRYDDRPPSRSFQQHRNDGGQYQRGESRNQSHHYPPRRPRDDRDNQDRFQNRGRANRNEGSDNRRHSNHHNANKNWSRDRATHSIQKHSSSDEPHHKQAPSSRNLPVGSSKPIHHPSSNEQQSNRPPGDSNKKFEQHAQEPGPLQQGENPPASQVNSVQDKFRPVPMDEFMAMTPLDQMKHLLPNELNFFDREQVLKPPEGFGQRTENAVQKTLSWLKTSWDAKEKERLNPKRRRRMEDSEDDSDSCPNSDDDGCFIVNDKLRPLPREYISFINSLRFCMPLDYGFHVVSLWPHQDQVCYCPLSDKLKTWRKQCGVSDTFAHGCSNTKRMDPNALVAHLRERGPTSDGIDWHMVVLKFQEYRYEKLYSPESNLSHRAFYPKNSAECVQAEAKEKARWHREMEILKDRAIAAEKRNRELENLKKVDEEKAKVAAAATTAIDVLKSQWEIPERAKGKTPTSKVIKYCRSHTDMSFDHLRIKYIDAKPKRKVKLELQDSFDLTSAFQTMLEEEHPLFCGDDLESNAAFLFDWDVQFKVDGKFVDVDKASNRRKAKKNYSDAKDKGGLTRQFLSKTWEQLANLQVPLDKKAERKATLFDTQFGRLWPTQNEFLKDKLGLKTDEETIRVIRPVGRAVGRILLYAIACRLEPDNEDCEMERFTVASHVVPAPFRRYLLQGIQPADEEYHTSDLFRDVFEYFVGTSDDSKNRSADDLCIYFDSFVETHFEGHDKGDIRPCEKLRHAAQSFWIDKRSIVLNSILEGLCYQKAKDMFLLGPEMSFGVMDTLLFSKHHMTAQDIIKVLDVRNEPEETPEGKQNYKYRRKVLSKDDDGQWQGHLVDLLLRKEKEEENSSFPSDFCEFATGTRFFSQDATIVIEFNPIADDEDITGANWHDVDETELQKRINDALPKAHTCERTIRFPGSAYLGDAEILESKLLKSIEYSRCSFMAE